MRGGRLEYPHHDGALRVSRHEIEQMSSAAVVIRDCRRELAARGADLLREVTAGSPTAGDWRHYPEGEAAFGDVCNHPSYCSISSCRDSNINAIFYPICSLRR